MKWRRVRTTHNTRWYPAGSSKSGYTKYIYSIEQRGRGGTWKYKKKPWRQHYKVELDLTWVALKKAWIAFYINLRYQDWEYLEMYSYVIQSIQEKLGLPITHFLIQEGEEAQKNYYKTRSFLDRKH